MIEGGQLVCIQCCNRLEIFLMRTCHLSRAGTTPTAENISDQHQYQDPNEDQDHFGRPRPSLVIHSGLTVCTAQKRGTPWYQTLVLYCCITRCGKCLPPASDTRIPGHHQCSGENNCPDYSVTQDLPQRRTTLRYRRKEPVLGRRSRIRTPICILLCTNLEATLFLA